MSKDQIIRLLFCYYKKNVIRKNPIIFIPALIGTSSNDMKLFRLKKIFC